MKETEFPTNTDTGPRQINMEINVSQILPVAMGEKKLGCIFPSG